MDTPLNEKEPIAPVRSPSPGEHPNTHLEREDKRWNPRQQLRDWIILLVMILIYLTWAGVVYLFEPGIR
ncbi:MAG: hypothetical protein A2Z27_04890 [candidate division Zixibacteria bacterium RBG_16_50_21]|nr:MAG: hypothetical protein A2Z27_04890 [candidate division Zixibacteria bacterium RBG_16_50_21]